MILAVTDQPWTLGAIEVPGVRPERAQGVRPERAQGVRTERAQGVPSDAEGTAEVPA